MGDATTSAGPKCSLPQDDVRIILHTVGHSTAVNGERWIHATPGDFLYVPEGGVHGFRNESSEPASMLILFAPGAPREAYFEALAEIAAGRKFSEEEWADICLRHDNYFIDPRSQSLYRKLLSNKIK